MNSKISINSKQVGKERPSSVRITDNNATYDGFTIKELWETFDQIRDKGNWKHPLFFHFSSRKVKDASFPMFVAKCKAAVAYYQGTKPMWDHNPDGSVTLTTKGHQGGKALFSVSPQKILQKRRPSIRR